MRRPPRSYSPLLTYIPSAANLNKRGFDVPFTTTCHSAGNTRPLMLRSSVGPYVAYVAHVYILLSFSLQVKQDLQERTKTYNQNTHTQTQAHTKQPHHLHSHTHTVELGITCRQADEASLALTFALTLALTVWMNSKWPPPPPSCWKAIGRWLKNHWKATSSEVSCVALQLSTTLSPTVTSTRLGLSSTRMASASTKLLHCHPRLTPWMN